MDYGIHVFWCVKKNKCTGLSKECSPCIQLCRYSVFSTVKTLHWNRYWIQSSTSGNGPRAKGITWLESSNTLWNCPTRRRRRGVDVRLLLLRRTSIVQLAGLTFSTLHAMEKRDSPEILQDLSGSFCDQGNSRGMIGKLPAKLTAGLL
jgi:hypothetical protein